MTDRSSTAVRDVGVGRNPKPQLVGGGVGQTVMTRTPVGGIDLGPDGGWPITATKLAA
jgi:hypothetical protein